MTNRELIEKFYDEVFNNWDLSNLDTYMKEDYIQHNPVAESGREGFVRFCDKFLAMKPHMEIKHIIEENDMESHILKEKGIGYSYGIYGSDLKILS